MSIHRCLIAIVLSWFTAAGVLAEIYKHVDKDGNISFSDQPRDGGEWVPLEPTNTVSPPQRWQYPTQQRSRPDTGSGHWQVQITQPSNDAVIPNGLAPTQVSARVNPAMASHQRARLLLDGTPVSEASRPSFTVDRIARGSHTLQVELRDGDTVLATSEPVSVFVYWPGGG